jgi:hypothetical protein
MADDIDDVKDDIRTLEKFTSTLETKLLLVDERKASKDELGGVEKRTAEVERQASDLKQKWDFYRGAAVFLGVSGIVISGFVAYSFQKLYDLKKQTDEAKTQVGLIKTLVEVDLPKRIKDQQEASVKALENARQAAINDLSEKASTLQQSTESDILSHLKISSYQYCVGENAEVCAPFKHVPIVMSWPKAEDFTRVNEAEAKKTCGPNATYSYKQYQEHGGNCCGYHFYTLVCTSFDK